MKKDFRFREIPYNYTSFSDREIIQKYFDHDSYEHIELLRNQRVTGRSAKLLFETIGDMFIIDRNPYMMEDFLASRKKLRQLQKLHKQRFDAITSSIDGNELVLSLVQKSKELNAQFFKDFEAVKPVRARILRGLFGITARKNVYFTPFHRVAHATDATDWRVEYPMLVVYPDSIEEIPKLICLAQRLHLSIIPRGGGTGLTGGAIPLNKRTMVLNIEKLHRIHGIKTIKQGEQELPVVSVEAGVVTDDVIEYCHERGYIFATDPTSAWASTIGGNIAENAGGKKCVMWGTAIDNLLSFRLVNARAEVLEIRRRNHPYRKILPTDTIVFDVVRLEGKKEDFIKTIDLKGTDIRKKGLGKDITNKVLKGVPGLQKEGGDGVIVSAEFVLYRPFRCSQTLCLEFFGSNMVNASKAILGIREAFNNQGPAYLTALEHFDEKYVLAINYRNKSRRSEIPKAVLLVDVEGNDSQVIENASLTIKRIVSKFNCEATIATDELESNTFWDDRKNLGAIAKHTNAFKLNEDIVIPLEVLPEFADFIENINLIKEVSNALAILEELGAYFIQLKKKTNNEHLVDRIQDAADSVQNIDDRYKQYQRDLNHLDGDVSPLLQMKEKTLFQRVQDGLLKISLRDDLYRGIRAIFHGYDEIIKELEDIVLAEQKRKIVIATHMHAGDGNIHVNIPVLSNDYLMMQEAEETAALIMRESVRMGGVVSGEHGIGLTKLRFIEHSALQAYRSYKQESDPEDLFNPQKLDERFPLSRVYTPSFNLLELEAFILEATDLEKLSMQIASCVRCGKCKGVCCTNYPQGGLLYHPRNKILAVGLITEAVLYFAQTMDMRSFRHFTKFNDIADHCTVCHKCRVPCPVKIDFGDATLAMRELLVRRKKSPGKLLTAVALFYLSRKKYLVNKLFRIVLLKIGYTVQRYASSVHKSLKIFTSAVAPKISALLEHEFPVSGKKTVRERLKLHGPNCFYSFENPHKPVRKSVLYFPGCGSERMFPEIGTAVLALLYHSGVRTVIPPEYSCCGYPFLANGKNDQAELRSYENRVILHRIADAVGYMEIDTVLVSCGTCMEMLMKYDIDNIFPGGKLFDINEFIVEERLFSAGVEREGKILYHEPCHTPLKTLGYKKTIPSLLNTEPLLVPHCCGEAGTLTLSRPDISSALRQRKKHHVVATMKGSNDVLLTSCPSCVLGLSKLRNGTNIQVKSLVVQVAEKYLGENWEKNFLLEAKKRGIQRILF